jgi:uncharacterized membrane protein YhhN
MEGSMSYFFFIAAGVIALVDWVAVARGWQLVEYIAKPATMVALIAWVMFNSNLSGAMIWFVVGLALSLAGDIFLMLPRNLFVAGLVAFLLAHVAYLVGLNTSIPPINLASLLVALIILLTAIPLYRKIAAGLENSGQSSLKMPVLVYTIVISLMLFSALLTLVRQNWGPFPALFVSGGALLFFFSDAVLAWNRFVTPLRYGRVINMSTYHLGQMGIALGATLQFLS